MWVKKILPPEVFWNFLPNSWEFLSKILHAYYVEIYSKLQNFFQLSLNLTQLCHIKCKTALQLTRPVRRRTGWGQRMNGLNQTSTHLAIICGCNASDISQTSLKAQDHSGAKKWTAADLGWLIADNDVQIITDFRKRLNACTSLGKWWTFWTHDMNFIQKYFDWTLFAVSDAVINCMF